MKKVQLLCVAMFAFASAVFSQPQEEVRLTLYQTHNAPVTTNTVGGVVVTYGDKTATSPSFHNVIDNSDVTYPGVYSPFSVVRWLSILYPNSPLMLERRAYVGTEIGSNNDTLPLMAATLGNTDTAYTIVIAVGRMNYGVVGRLEDLYLGTSIPININPSDTAYTTYQFSVIGRNGTPAYWYQNNPWIDLPHTGSKSLDRFRIVFSNNATYTRSLFQFVTLQAIQQSTTELRVRWKAINLESVAAYEIEGWKDKRWQKIASVSKAEDHATITGECAMGVQKVRIKAKYLNGTVVYSDPTEIIAAPETPVFSVVRLVAPGFKVLSVQPGKIQISFTGECGRATVTATSTRTGRRVVVRTVDTNSTLQLQLPPFDTYAISVRTGSGLLLETKQLFVQ